MTAHIRFEALTLAYRVVNSTVRPYLKPLGQYYNLWKARICFVLTTSEKRLSATRAERNFQPVKTLLSTFSNSLKNWTRIRDTGILIHSCEWVVSCPKVTWDTPYTVQIAGQYSIKAENILSSHLSISGHCETLDFYNIKLSHFLLLSCLPLFPLISEIRLQSACLS